METTQTMTPDELVAVLETKAAEVEPYTQLDCREMARYCLDNEVDPDAVLARLRRAGQTSQELNAELVEVEKRRADAAVFAELKQRQIAERATIDHHADCEKAGEMAREAVESEHAKTIREAMEAKQVASEAVQESKAARSRLMASATKAQREAKRTAALGRAAAAQRLAAARDAMAELESQVSDFENDLKRIESGEFPRRHYSEEAFTTLLGNRRSRVVEHETGNPDSIRDRTEENLTRAKQAVERAKDDVAGCVEALDFAKGSYDAAVEEMLLP